MTVMTIPHLPPEVWSKVIGNLRRPLPTPTGLNTRDSFRQPELAGLMRVCSMFNEVTAPYLYRQIITDHMPSLVYNAKKPASARGIKSKRELLGYTERLYLEYCDKGEPTYVALLKHGGKLFSRYDPLVEDILPMCEDETDWITDSAEILTGMPQRLLSVSTGAFLGGQPEIWKEIWLSKPPLIDIKRIGEARYALSSLVVDPHLTYCCQWVQFGPLIFGPAIWTDKNPKTIRNGPTSLQQTIHIGSEPIDAPALFGGVSRWYCSPNEPPKNKDAFTALTKTVVNTLAMHITNRQRSFDQFKLDHPSRVATGPFLSADIYLPAAMFRPDVLQFVRNSIEENKKRNYQSGRVPLARYSGDDWRLKEMKDAPKCLACGWSAADHAYL